MVRERRSAEKADQATSSPSAVVVTREERVLRVKWWLQARLTAKDRANDPKLDIKGYDSSFDESQSLSSLERNIDHYARTGRVSHTLALRSDALWNIWEDQGYEPCSSSSSSPS